MDTTIRTARLTLRPPALQDGAALTAHFADYDVVKMTGSLPHPYLRPAADFWIMRTLSRVRRGLGHSYMLETSDGAVIGNVSLFRGSDEDDFEIGYHIGREWWGQGFATESCRAVIGAATRAGHTRLVAGVYDDNSLSHRVMDKLGFVETARDNIFCMARQRRVSGRRYALDLMDTTSHSAETASVVIS